MQREDQIVSIIKNDDGTISIEGQKGSYTQKLIRSLALRISHLTVSRSFRTDEDNGFHVEPPLTHQMNNRFSPVLHGTGHTFIRVEYHMCCITLTSVL